VYLKEVISHVLVLDQEDIFTSSLGKLIRDKLNEQCSFGRRTERIIFPNLDGAQFYGLDIEMSKESNEKLS